MVYAVMVMTFAIKRKAGATRTLQSCDYQKVEFVATPPVRYLNRPADKGIETENKPTQVVEKEPKAILHKHYNCAVVLLR